MKGVILDADSLGPDDVDLGPVTRLPVEWTLYGSSKREQVAERIADAAIVLTNKAPIGAAELVAAPGLRYIGEIGRASCRERV